MTLEEYLTRFQLLQHGVEKDERMLALLQGKAYRSFVRLFGESPDPHLCALILSEEEVKRRMERKKRLSERYARRIAKACLKMESVELREYAICHYLYGMTHEDIAERSYFCVRTVYRQAKQAKEQLRCALLSVMPRHRRTGPGRFRVKSRIRLRSYALDRISRSVAAASARRRKAAPITAGYFCRESLA